MAPPRSPPHLLLALVALAACRATTATAPSSTASVLPTPEAPASHVGDVLVRAREAPRMPVCEATDAITAAALSPSVAAHPTIARRGDVGLVAFITDPHGDGGTRLNLLSLGAQASPTDARGDLRDLVELTDTGPAPTYPALAAFGEGYLLAWREGPRGRHRVMVRRLDPRGVPQGAARAVGPAGILGAPALHVEGDHWTVAVARADTMEPDGGRDRGVPWGSHVDVTADEGASRAIAAPAGARFDGSAPVIVTTPAGVRVYATVARRGAVQGDERALLRLLDGEQPTMVARDLDHPAALATPQGVLLAWRARMTRHDTSVRAVRLPHEGFADAPPVTLATYRGAFELAPAIAPLGRGLVGVFSVSTLSDDAAGSLNVSLLDDAGQYIGRAAVLTGFPTRTAQVSVAAAPAGASDAAAWFAIDGRATDGSGPKLLLTRASCDPTRTADPLDVPPGTFLQDISAADPAPRALARGASEQRCTARNHGVLAPHLSGVDDVLVGTSAGVAVTPTGASLFAVTRATAGAAPKLVYATLDPQGRPTPTRPALDDAAEVLAVEAVPGAVVAVVNRTVRGVSRPFVVTARGATLAGRPFATAYRDASSAVVVPETGAIFLVARDDAGATALVHTPWTAGAPGASTPVAWLRRGDAVVDAMRQDNTTQLLLTRADGMGGELGQSVAQWTLRDGPSPAAAARDARDVFADPLGHARRGALWMRVAGAPALAYDENHSLRVADVVDGGLRNARSVLDLFPAGGAVLSSSWGGGGVRWLALATGFPDEQHGAMRPVTLAALDDRGEVRALTTALPNDNDAIPSGIALGARGERVVLLHPRTERAGGMSWAWIDVTCTLPGEGR
jgi:hypothetical protein